MSLLVASELCRDPFPHLYQQVIMICDNKERSITVNKHFFCESVRTFDIRGFGLQFCQETLEANLETGGRMPNIYTEV